MIGSRGEVDYNTGEGSVLCCGLSGNSTIGAQVGIGCPGAVGVDSQIDCTLGSDVRAGHTIGIVAGAGSILRFVGVGPLGSKVGGGTNVAFSWIFCEIMW